MTEKLVKKNDLKDKLYSKADAEELEESLATIAILEKQIAEAKAIKLQSEKGVGRGSKIDKEEIKNLQRECKEEKKKASRLEVELAEQTASREKLQLELDSIKSKLASLDPNNVVVGIRPHEQTAIDTLDAKIELKSRELKTSKEKISTLEKNIKNLDQQLLTLEKEKERLRVEMMKGNEEVERLRKELKIEEKKAKGAEVWQKNLKEAFKERDQALEDLRKTKENEAKLKKELEGKGAEMSGAIKDAEAKIDASIARMEKEIRGKEIEVKKCKAELAAISKENDAAKAELKTKSQEMETLKQSVGVTPSGEMKFTELIEAESKVSKLEKGLQLVESNILKQQASNDEILEKTASLESSNPKFFSSKSNPTTSLSFNGVGTGIEPKIDLQASLAHSKSTLSSLQTELNSLRLTNENLRTSIAAKERELAAESLVTPPNSPESKFRRGGVNLIREMQEEGRGGGISREEERDLEEAKEEAKRNRERVESLENRFRELEGMERLELAREEEDQRSEAASSLPSRPPSTSNFSQITNTTNANEQFVVERLVKSIRVLSDDTARLRSENTTLLLQIAGIEV